MVGSMSSAAEDQKNPECGPNGAAIEAEPTPWPQFVLSSTDTQVRARLANEVQALVVKHAPSLDKYCLLSLYDPEGRITSWDSDRIFSALQAENPDRKKDVFLLIVSRGGHIEPAYQISKICKAFAKETFVVAVPRHAKSAATLITLGADKIHMGMLGELGPIDPQLGNLPALGVKRALETIAGLCQQYPGSSEAFSRYMASSVTIEQIGYCERVGESAVQYAERLLGKKEKVRPHANRIAKELVYEYKDHSFVIDIEEAREHLGDFWVVGDSAESKFAEEVYQTFDHAYLPLEIYHKKLLTVVGSMKNGYWIFNKS